MRSAQTGRSTGRSANGGGPPATGHLGIDVGKSTTRARLETPDGRRHDGDGPGFNHAAQRDLVAGVLAGLRPALPQPAAPVGRCLVALTGAPTEPAATARLLDGISRTVGAAAVAICPDYVAAHAGAIAGPGVLIVAGTGAIAYAVRDDGSAERVDGWGPHLGDDGGGYAVGRAGLRAAFAAEDGRGPATALRDLAARELGGVDYAAAHRLHSRPDAVAAVAEFARHVVTAAGDGDQVATVIWADAVHDLARTVTRAAERAGVTRVSHTGRLFEAGPQLTTPLRRLLTRQGLHLTAPLGGPLDGALRLCGPDAEHYRHLLAATPAWDVT